LPHVRHLRRDDVALTLTQVSPVQVRDRRFVDLVREVLAETKIDPSRVVLEITEGVLIGNYRRIEIAIVPLAAAGPSRAYTLVSDKRSAELRPSDHYMALLIEGAEIHGLPAAWIATLRAVPTCVASPEVLAGRRFLDDSLASLRRPRD
jgi:hypothetical protein